jgi:hypothetical protein
MSTVILVIIETISISSTAIILNAPTLDTILSLVFLLFAPAPASPLLSPSSSWEIHR